MKRSLCCWMVILSCIFSCKKSSHDAPVMPPPPPKAPDVLTVSRANITVGAVAGFTDTLVVNGNVNWTLSVAAGGEWLGIDKQKGDSGSTRLTLSVNQSDTAGTRSATVTVTPTGSTSTQPVTFTVMQTTLSLVWQRVLGGSLSEGVGGIARTTDGGFVAAGVTESNDGDVVGNPVSTAAGWVVKVDAAGVKQWQRPLGGVQKEAGLQLFQGITATADGGVVVVGATNSDSSGAPDLRHGLEDLWAVKLDASGNIVWNRLFGGSGRDQGTSITTTTDGGLLIAGSSSSNDGDVAGNHGSTDAWLLKLDGNGNKQWSKLFGGSSDEMRPVIAASPDGGFLLACTTESINGDIPGNKGIFDIALFKVDANGNKQWVKDYGGSRTDFVNDVAATSDGGFVVTGTTLSNDGDFNGNHSSNDDMVALKINKDGGTVWVRLLGGTNYDQGWGVAAAADGGVMITGYTTSTDGDMTGIRSRGGEDLWLVKIDGNGKIVWEDTYGGVYTEIGYSIVPASDGGFVAGGLVTGNNGDVSGAHNGDYDIWLLKVK